MAADTQSGMGKQGDKIMGNSIITWADGFGVWHARVPVGTPDAAKIARREILAELRARERNVSASRVTVELIDADSATGDTTYREVTS